MERKAYEKIVKKHPKFTLKRDLKIKQVSNILKHIARDIKENDIIGFYDAGLIRSGKSGILIAKHAVYYDFRDMKVPFKDLIDISYVNKGSVSMDASFTYKDGHIETYFISLPGERDLFIQILKEIADQYNSMAIIEEEKETPEVTEVLEKISGKDEMTTVVTPVEAENDISAILPVETVTTVVSPMLDEPMSAMIPPAPVESMSAMIPFVLSEPKVAMISLAPAGTEKKTTLKEKLQNIDTESDASRVYDPKVLNMLKELEEEASDAIVFDDDYETAIKKYKILAQYGKHEAYYNLAECYCCLGEYEEAVKWADKVDVNKIEASDKGEICFLIAQAYYETRCYDQSYRFAKLAFEAGQEEAQDLLEVLEEELE